MGAIKIIQTSSDGTETILDLDVAVEKLSSWFYDKEIIKQDLINGVRLFTGFCYFEKLEDKKMYKIGKIEFYENKGGGTVEILQDNKIIKKIEFIIWNSGKIELDDELGFVYGELYKDVIKRIELKSKSKY